MSVHGHFAGLRRSPAYSLASFGGLKYGYDNSTAFEGQYASIPDRSTNGRTLTVGGTGGTAPQGFPRNWDENGNPVISIDSSRSQFAYDAAGDALAYASFINQPGFGVCLRGQLNSDGSGINVGIAGNWNILSSNQNAFQIYYAGSTMQLSVAVTSTAGGGTVHVLQQLAANAIRPGDVFELVFLYQSDRTWTLDVRRMPRAPGDTVTTFSFSGTGAAGAASGASFGLTLGTRGDRTIGFVPFNYYSLAIFTIGVTTTADVAAWRAATRAACEFNILAFDQSNPLVYPTDYNADGIHWMDSGQAKVAAAGGPAETALAIALGIATGSNDTGCIGDSRLGGATASVIGVTDARAELQAAVHTYTRVSVGPVNDGSGTPSANHFCRSGYTTRSAGSGGGAQNGHSQRSPDATTVNNWWGIGKPYNNVRMMHVIIGINDLDGANTWARDWVDELVRWLEFQILSQRAASGITPGFVLYTEPVTGTTTTGALQRLIRSRNRSYSAAVRYLRGITSVQFVELNDETYFP